MRELICTDFRFFPFSVDQPVILRMCADPEPNYTVLDRDAERPVMKANPYRAELANPFKVKGRMPGGFLQKFEVGIGEFLHRVRKGCIALPESWRSEMVQSRLHWPLP